MNTRQPISTGAANPAMRNEHNASTRAHRPRRGDRRRIGWRIISREAWRNVISGTSHTALTSLLLGLCLTLMMGADYLSIGNLISQARNWVDSGASTYVITLADGIDGTACDHLSSVNGVAAAGATRQRSDKLTFATLPSVGIPSYDVTPGFLGVFDSLNIGNANQSAAAATSAGTNANPGTGLLLSQTVADQLGTHAGDTQPLRDGGDITVRDVYRYPSDGRESGYGYAALIPGIANGAYTSCVVRTWPTPDSIETLMRTTVLTNANSQGSSAAADANQRPQAHVSQLNTSLGRNAPNTEAFRNRPTAFAPWLMLALAMALGFTVTRSRRLELASALHTGYPKRALTMQILLEVLMAYALALAISAPLLAYAALDVSNPGDLMPMLNALLRIPAGGFAGLLLGTLLAVAMTREKQLFAYFKRR